MESSFDRKFSLDGTEMEVGGRKVSIARKRRMTAEEVQMQTEQLAQLRMATDAIVQLANAQQGHVSASASSNDKGYGMKAPPDRERILNDVANTGVMAALIGGFAFTNLEDGVDEAHGWVGWAVYLSSSAAVHACTCSALTSALLYREANALRDDSAEAWAEDHKIMLLMAPLKFGMGVIAYLFSVVLISWKDLTNDRGVQIASLCIGAMSMSTVFGTVFKIASEKRREKIGTTNDTVMAANVYES